jgi:Fe-S cluster assembly ATPase SufC
LLVKPLVQRVETLIELGALLVDAILDAIDSGLDAAESALDVVETFFDHVEARQDLAVLIASDGALLEVLVKPLGDVFGHAIAPGLTCALRDGNGHRSRE